MRVTLDSAVSETKTPATRDAFPFAPPSQGDAFNRRVLFVAYAFPPVGGAGVQRTTKFVKYLRSVGWNASVLTVSEASVPVVDISLTPDIPPDTIVCRARTMEPSYATKQAATDSSSRLSFRGACMKAARRTAQILLQPDPQILWAPHALYEGLRLLRSVPHDAIIASGPPFSCFLVGAQLARRSKLPLVLDYRDEWDLSNLHYENRQPGPLISATQQAMQGWVLRSASAVVATTQGSSDALLTRARHAQSPAEVTWIYNGYDNDDFQFDEFEVLSSLEHREKFRLVYAGTLWNLMSIEPLLQAVTLLSTNRPDLVEALEVVFAGRCLPEQQVFVDRLRALPCTVVQHDYVDHAKAVRMMCAADALCLLLADKEGASRWVPGKTFEYMATGRSIIAVVPPGEVRQLLSSHPGTTVVAPHEVDKLAAVLERQIARHVSGMPSYRGIRGCPHNRQVQASQLGALLDKLTGKIERRRQGREDDPEQLSA